MDLTALDGKALTLLLLGTTPEGDDDWAVFPGISQVEDGQLYIDRGAKPRFDIRPEWIDRIQAVDPALREMLRDADYYLPLTVGSLPTGDDGDDLIQTGLKWPS
jgi:hypothetical protein